MPILQTTSMTRLIAVKRIISISILAIVLLSSWMALDPCKHGNTSSNVAAEPSILAQDEWINVYPRAIPCVAQVGTTIQFNASFSSDYFGTIVNYTWTFADGNKDITLYGMVAEYVFDRPAIYEVNLTERDDHGTDGWAVVYVDIRLEAPVNYPPTVEAGWDTFTLAEWTTYLQCTAWDDLGIVRIVWNFTDEGIPFVRYGLSFYYHFQSNGIHQITVNVTDWGGLWAKDTVNVTVLAPPRAEAGPNQTVNVMQTVYFDGSGSEGEYSGIINYTWLIYDNGPITKYGMVVTYTYTIPGDYWAHLTVRNELWQEASDWLIIHVQGETSAPPSVEAGLNRTIEPGTLVIFNGSATGSEPFQYTWNFFYNGTHQVLFGKNPRFQFLVPGIYTINLTVSDAYGRSNSDTVVIVVHQISGVDSFLNKYGLIMISGIAIAAIAATLVSLDLWRKRKP